MTSSIRQIQSSTIWHAFRADDEFLFAHWTLISYGKFPVLYYICECIFLYLNILLHSSDSRHIRRKQQQQQPISVKRRTQIKWHIKCKIVRYLSVCHLNTNTTVLHACNVDVCSWILHLQPVDGRFSFLHTNTYTVVVHMHPICY